MKTILFSTTKNWNVGDEIILAGIKNLLRKLDLEFTSVIWNRHPSINPDNMGLDNSFDVKRHKLEAIDYIIIAGSPEWASLRNRPMFAKIVRTSKKVAFVGIGCSSPPFLFDGNRILMEVMKKHTELIITRDENTFLSIRNTFERSNSATKVNIDCPKLFLRPCPALFASATVKNVRTINTIGIIFQTTRTSPHSISRALFKSAMKLYRIICKEFRVKLICHYIDDFIDAVKFFPKAELLYSPELNDYYDFYRNVDLTIGTRLHGAIFALSNGTPAILLSDKDNFRVKSTASLFDCGLYHFSLPIHGQKLINFIDSLDIVNTSDAIVKFKAKNEEEMTSLLCENLSLFN
jgi:polysaccharide pyruvyl transferase WcaK-like protein